MLRGLGNEEGAAGSAVLPFGMKVQVGSKQAWQSWVGRNKWGVLFSSMAMAHVLRTSEPSSTKSTGNMTSIDTFGTLALLCVMFIGGVSTGFLWKAYGKIDNQVSKAQQKTETQAPTTSTKELFQVAAREEPPSTPPVPRARTSAVGIVRQYSLSEVMEMTDDCKIELGRGGQGVVYFANLLPLGDGKHAAVKRLQKSANFLMVESLQSRETVEREFWSELHTIYRLHHRNLVALLGYCIEDDDLFLVYEYMAGGSLDQHLHKNEDGVCRLDWKARLRCAVEVAQGLEYLHSHANPSLVHRDIKSGNILFDDEMHAKIADFGLSKPLSPGQDPTISTRVRGTHGYVDPEYLMTGQPSNKNDVYSYGVVLLELITGRKAIQKKVSLVTWCKDFLAADEILMRHLLTKIVDSRIVPVDEAQEKQLLDVVMVAKDCVQEKQDLRPSMQDVVAALYNANSKEYSSSDSEASNDLHMDLMAMLPTDGTSTVPGTSLEFPPAPPRQRSGLACYEIRENTILVKCMVGNSKIQLRCKIWPTPKNFGLNKVEASVNGAFVWKKGLWWYNAKSSREFTVDDEIKVTAEWHVALRTSSNLLKPDDPRRAQGPFCVEYLAIKDEEGGVLIEYLGDASPLPPPSINRRESIESSKGGSGSGGSGSAERRRINHLRRSRS